MEKTISPVFREKVDAPVSSSAPLESKEASKADASSPEVPYTAYESENAHPYIVDHFQIGDTWNDPVGGFPKEVATIEEYFKSKIDSGEIPNSTSAVKDSIKAIEKMNHVDKDERALVRIETVAAYIKFLMETDNIKSNLRRYGNTK